MQKKRDLVNTTCYKNIHLDIQSNCGFSLTTYAHKESALDCCCCCKSADSENSLSEL